VEGEDKREYVKWGRAPAQRKSKKTRRVYRDKKKKKLQVRVPKRASVHLKGKRPKKFLKHQEKEEL